MKLLFITHSSNLVYGAARSLNLLLKNAPFHYDIVFSKQFLRYHSADEVKGYVGPNCDNIFYCDLLLDYSMMQSFRSWDKDKSFLFNLKEIGSSYKKAALYYIHKKELLKIIETGNYDFIHLNSSVLYPILTSKYNMAIHIRELLPSRIPFYAKRKFSKAKTVICIEEPVKKHFLTACGGNGIDRTNVLLNPFDMRSVKTIDLQSALREYDLDANTTIFTIAGVVSPSKGVDFVIDSFLSKTLEKKVLLVVGNDTTPTAVELKKKYIGQSSIRFLGEIKNMDSIYAITDYIVRGEPEFCTGRTVYEALFSGCSVLIPGTEQDINDGAFLPDQKERVHFYEPLDGEALSTQFSNLVKTSKSNYVESNIDDYVKNFVSIMERNM